MTALLAGVASGAFAQSARAVADARADAKAGRFQAALDRLEGEVSSEAVLAIRIDAALGLGDAKLALSSYETLIKPPAKERPDLASRIASVVLAQLARSEDPELQFQACAALAGSKASPCREVMEGYRKNPAAPLSVRLGALAALSAAGDATSTSEFVRLAATAQGMATRSIPALAAKLPPATAVTVLGKLLDDPDRTMQFAAASMLGECGEAARPVLHAYLARTEPRPLARGAAEFALIRTGDRDALAKYPGPLDKLVDEDALIVGIALVHARDARGLGLIRRAAASDNEMLRLRAAARLGASDAVAARKALGDALASRNIWIRAAALREFKGTAHLAFASAREQMSDAEPWVQLRAAEAVLAAPESKALANAAARPTAPSSRRSIK